MSYHAQIEKAVSYALSHRPSPQEVAEWPSGNDGPVSTPTSMYAFLSGQSDHVPVHFVNTGEVDPNEVFVDAVNPEAFQSLFKASAEVMGVPYSADDGQETFHHESQHFAIADKLGAVGNMMGLSYHTIPHPDRPGFALVSQPMTRFGTFTTTKLGAALICAYPDVPSAGDKRDVQAMGYENVDEVAERIMRRVSSTYYPLPRSYESAAASRLLRCTRWLQTHLLRNVAP